VWPLYTVDLYSSGTCINDDSFINFTYHVSMRNTEELLLAPECDKWTTFSGRRSAIISSRYNK